MIAAFSRKRAVLLLAACALVLDIGVAVSMSTTYDEEDHIDSGIRILSFHPDRLSTGDDSKMPITALNAIPRAAARILENHHIYPRLVFLLDNIRAARLATVVAALALIFFVSWWAYDLYGSRSALPPSLPSVLSPNPPAPPTLAPTPLYFP